MATTTLQTVYLKDYRIPDYLIDTVDLEFDLGEAFTLVKSRLKMAVNGAAINPARELVLKGRDLELVKILLNNKELTEKDYKANADSLTLHHVPDRFDLEIHTRIKPQENTALIGLYKSSGNFCTQCEAEGFRRITYFLDRPDVMAKYTTKIIADKKLYPVLLSNGNLIDQGDLPDGKHWAAWQDPFKKPSYLFALVAGHLEQVEDYFVTQSGRKITLRIFVEQGNQDKCAHAMQAIKKAMRWDEEQYGREYDLDIYMIVAVSDFNMGAMENKGLNIFNTQYILARPETATDTDYIHIEGVIAHEYFHNWTGNRITCRDWFQLSLKEGLTVFRDQSFTADTTSQTVARIQDVNGLRIAQFAEDAGPLAHPVRPDAYMEINNFYTSTIYEKGAEVIRMMRTILGKENYRKGMDLYFSRHDGQAVTTEEFVKAMEDASDMDLSQFRLWYSQAGTPHVHVTDSYDAEKKIYALTIEQSLSATPGQKNKKPMHIPIKIGLMNTKGGELQSALLHLKLPKETFYFNDIAEKPVPSLLRDFTAPVKLDYDYTDADLQLLFKHDTDLFNRWEAGQKYALNLLLRLIATSQQGGELNVPVAIADAFRSTLSTVDDKLLLAELLMLPSEKYIAAQMAIVDPVAIHKVRNHVSHFLAMSLKTDFMKYYENNQEPHYEFNMTAAGKRQLKNLSLHYLMLLDDPGIHQDIGYKQFHTALKTNMTDTLSALRSLTNIVNPLRDKALEEFYQYWQHDALVVGKWLTLQAVSKLPDTLNRVKELVLHPAFDIKNPNKVYALIGAFCNQNPALFHAENGEGYRFLTENILRLNQLNPQIAARILTPLTQWRRFDVKRQDLMKHELKKILQEKNISKDVYELVSKSLGENT